jgi:hypothetical protein
MNRVLGTILVLAAALMLAASPAVARFCGGNGNVALSFDSEQTVSVLEAEPDASGRITVDVWAILEDVVQVEGPGGVMLAVGGIEMTLRIQGAEAQILEKTIVHRGADFGANEAEVMAGLAPGEVIEDGRLTLVHWRVAVAGDAQDVVFDLAPGGARSCKTIEGCAGKDCRALYAGTVDAAQESFLFGAGHRPAVLNPTGEPDLAVVPCRVSYEEIGIFTTRKPRGER